jgi:hypothetical protein
LFPGVANTAYGHTVKKIETKKIFMAIVEDSARHALRVTVCHEKKKVRRARLVSAFAVFDFFSEMSIHWVCDASEFREKSNGARVWNRWQGIDGVSTS